MNMLDSAEFLKTIPPFENFFRDLGETNDIPEYVQDKVAFLKELIVNPETGLTWWNWLLNELERASQVSEVPSSKLGRQGRKNRSEHQSWPDQGLVRTGYEGDLPQPPPLVGRTRLKRTPEPEVDRYDQAYVEMTLYAWIYYLELFNHPERLKELWAQSEKPFPAPAAATHPIFEQAREHQQALTILDMSLTTHGSDKDRLSRTDRLLHGPFVNPGRDPAQLPDGENAGRMQARGIFAGGANPDIFGSSLAISTLAQTHNFAPVPRDGFFADVSRQVALARKVFELNRMSPVLIGKSDAEKAKLIDAWDHNVMGVIDANPHKAAKRALALYMSGVNTFRIYSPEPGNGPLHTLQKLREMEKRLGWEPIEIFVGQVIDVAQAEALQAAGANGLYIGIGGGGRCITGVVGNLAINWPELLMEMRGKITIPIVVEGGASDAIGVTISLGGSYIGATGKLGGNIENPGGWSVFVDEKEQVFVYYGGEASDRMRAMADRLSPFGRVEFTEGETRRIVLTTEPGRYPTMLQALFNLMQGEIGVEIFQNAPDIESLQRDGLKTLRLDPPNGWKAKNTH